MDPHKSLGPTYTRSMSKTGEGYHAVGVQWGSIIRPRAPLPGITGTYKGHIGLYWQDFGLLGNELNHKLACTVEGRHRVCMR